MTKSHPIDIHIGKLLRQRRTLLGMSQSGLGAAMGVSFQQVQKYERGANRIGATQLFELSRVLDIPMSFFFEGAPHMPGHSGMGEAVSPAYVSDFLATSDGLSLTKSFIKIKSSKLRRRIVELVEQMADSQTR